MDQKWAESGVVAWFWERSTRAVRAPEDPWRFPVLTTRCPSDSIGQTRHGLEVDARIVVLRKADDTRRQLTFFTDSRSPKVTDIRSHPGGVWVFYDPVDRVQVRVGAQSVIHTLSAGDKPACDCWEQVPEVQRGAYGRVHPPGTPEVENTPLLAVDEVPAVTDGRFFAVGVSTVTTLDALWLGPRGHVRVRCTWDAQNWSSVRVAP